MKANRLENPCQPGSAAHRIVGVLLSSRKRSLLATEIALRAKINTAKVRQVVSALLNPFHNASIAKAGLAVKRAEGGGFCVAACRPKPNARRPAPKGMVAPAATAPKAEPPPASEIPPAFDGLPDLMEAAA